MPPIKACELPPSALLNRCLVAGAFADCYFADIARPIALPEYVEAFYTTAVFRVERLILKLLASRPSTDLQAKQLADGSLSSFAAWRVEGRGPSQLLLSDFTGRTRSWLMVDAIDVDGTKATRPYFGSAVVPVVPVINPKADRPSLGLVFNSLLGFHKLYSRILLSEARSRLIIPNKRLKPPVG